MPIDPRELKWFAETEVKIYNPNLGSPYEITVEDLYQAIKARLMCELTEYSEKESK